MSLVQCFLTQNIWYVHLQQNALFLLREYVLPIKEQDKKRRHRLPPLSILPVRLIQSFPATIVGARFIAPPVQPQQQYRTCWSIVSNGDMHHVQPGERSSLCCTSCSTFTAAILICWQMRLFYGRYSIITLHALPWRK